MPSTKAKSLGELQAGFPDSDLAANLIYSPYPIDGADPGTDVSVKIDAFPTDVATFITHAIDEIS